MFKILIVINKINFPVHTQVIEFSAYLDAETAYAQMIPSQNVSINSGSSAGIYVTPIRLYEVR